MEIKRGVCIFCETGSSFKDREHVFPRWILKELGILTQREQYSETITEINKVGQPIFNVIVRQTKNYDNYVSPYVCDDCNGGWMSNLEGSVKPVLLPLIHGIKSFGKLSKEERILISRWAIKTTCVIDSVDHSTEENRTPVAADGNLIRKMSTSYLPRGWGVFAMTHKPTRAVGYECNSNWYVEGKLSETLKTELAHFRRTFIQVGNLILVTAFIGSPKLILKAVGFTHYPFSINLKIQWIKQPTGGWVGFDDLLDNSTENIAKKFAGALSLRTL